MNAAMFRSRIGENTWKSIGLTPAIGCSGLLGPIKVNFGIGRILVG